MVIDLKTRKPRIFEVVPSITQDAEHPMTRFNRVLKNAVVDAVSDGADLHDMRNAAVSVLNMIDMKILTNGKG